MLTISWTTTAEVLGGDETAAQTTEHTLQFDAVVKEQHISDSVVTQHTIETGEAIADHKRANPRRISIQAIVSNTPLDTPPPSGPNGSLVTGEIQKTGLGNVLVFSEDFDRVSDVWETLLVLQKGSVDLTVSTRWQVYEQVQLVSVGAPRDTPEESIAFDLSLQEVFRASSRLVDDPSPREPRAARRQEQNQAPEEGDSDPEGEQDSLLWQAISAL